MVVNFNKYIQKRAKNTVFTEIINQIKNDGQAGRNFSSNEIINFARQILSSAKYYTNNTTPIIRIASDIGITTYSTTKLENEISGVIYVNGTTKDIYGIDKVILVDSNEPYKHQRFVVAHEIAHYLFDCLTDSIYNDTCKLFKETYPKKDHDSPKEARADMFAAELLMPAELFVKQYNFAMNEKNNRMFTLMYLSEFFQTKITSIEKRIDEVLH